MVANQPKIYGWRNNPVSSAVTADFNHDGNLDLSEVSAGLRTFLGNGDGTFHFGSISPRKLNVGMGLAFGDFNGDGMLDLVLTSGRDLRVAFGEGTGKFHIGPFFGTLYNPQQIVTADFNGDGKLDLVVTDSAGGLRVLLGNGDGTFQPQVDYPIQSADITVADFNGDGIPDLVVENDKNGEWFLSLFIGKGDGTFQPPQDITSFSSFPGGFGPNLFLSDFNGDGLSDLAFGVRGKIGILIGKGDGSFQPPVFYSSGYPATEAFAFTAGDFNSDGNTDLLTYGFSKTKAKLLAGKGDGTFQPASGVNHPRRFGPEMGFLVGDFNSDGLLDFVALDASGGMAVYTQK
jgi:FG-GAP-like repeat